MSNENLVATFPVEPTVEENVNKIANELDTYEADLPSQKDSLLEALPWQIKQKIEALPPEYVDRTPAEIAMMMEEKGVKRTETVETLRDAFWMEYDKAVRDGRKMIIQNIFFDICSWRTFNNHVDIPLKLAYIITPVIKYDARLHTLLRMNAVNIMQDILSVSCKEEKSMGFDEQGNEIKKTVVNEKLARLQLAVITQMEDRTQGTPVQKTEVRQVNLNLNKDVTAKPRSAEEIQTRIKALDEEIRRTKAKEDTTQSIKDFYNAEFRASKEDE